MKSGLRLAFIIHFFLVDLLLSQVPSVQLKVKERSGFLGLGGARYVELRLSGANRQQPLTSADVKMGSLYYFECTPAGDWELDQDFVKEVLSTLTIEQNSLRESVASVGEIKTQGDTTSVLLGFSKDLVIHEPFLFRIRLGDVQYQVQYTVPIEYWPGYVTVRDLLLKADKELFAGQFRDAIASYNAIVANDTFQIFPQQAEAKEKLVGSFQAYLNANTSALQALKDSTQLDPTVRIAKIARFRPLFMFVVDSLPALRFELEPYDSSVASLLGQARNAVLRVGSVTDSLQNALDESTVRWILDGSVTGKSGQQYQRMIEALAYAYSSLDFADSNATTLSVTLPDDIRAGLEKNGTIESFNTFVRVSNDRYHMKLAMFPVDFLPNLRKDTAAFPLPFYSMLKAVSDYYGGNLLASKGEIFSVFRTCYVPELLRRFDRLRVIIDWKLNGIPSNIFRLLNEGRELQARNEFAEAVDKFHQAVIIEPGFAFAPYELGEFYLASGDSALGASQFQKAYSLDTLYLSAYLESYNLSRIRGDLMSMIDVMSMAVARGNDYWITNYDLGVALVANDQASLAIHPLRRALDLNPRSYETCMQLGLACQATKDFKNAREYFNKAIEIDALRKEAVDALSKLNELEHSLR